MAAVVDRRHRLAARLPRGLALPLAVIPVAAVVTAYVSFHTASAAVALAAAIGVAIAWLAWWSPDTAVMAALVMIPGEPVLVALMSAAGATEATILTVGHWKIALLAFLGIGFLVRQERWTTAHKVAVAFIALAAAYLLAPEVGIRVGSPTSLGVRVAAFREDVSYLVIFLALSRGVASSRRLRQFELLIVGLGVFYGLSAFWEYFSLPTWKAVAPFLGVHPLPHYETQGGVSVLRADGAADDRLHLAYFELVPFGLLLGRVVLGRARWWEWLALLVCAGGVVLTFTRSATLALPAMLLVGFVVWRRFGRFLATSLILVAASLPLLSVLPITDRFGVLGATSNTGHIQYLLSSWNRLLDAPLGTGLGTGGYIAALYHVLGGTVNESWFLQMSTELGLLGLVLFAVFISILLRDLFVGFRRSPALLGSWLALLGITVCGLVAHTFEAPLEAWPVFALTAVALRPSAAAAPAHAGQPEAIPAASEAKTSTVNRPTVKRATVGVRVDA